MNDFGIIKAPYDLEDGVDGTDVGQESIAQPGSSRGASGQTSDIVDCEVGRNTGLGLILLAKPIEPGVGDDDSSLLRINGCVGEILGRKKNQ